LGFATTAVGADEAVRVTYRHSWVPVSVFVAPQSYLVAETTTRSRQPLSTARTL
jgi:hypothetical protein